ncbi:MAG: squalene/phytoene synthase family protein, partial [Pacificimonas sp.]
LPSEMLAAHGVTPGDHARPEHRAALVDVVTQLLALADSYYESAAEGATHLPPRAAWAVLTAAGVYRAIGLKVRALGPAAWDARQYTTLREKLGYLMAARRGVKAAAVPLHARPNLWTFGHAPVWRAPERTLTEVYA